MKNSLKLTKFEVIYKNVLQCATEIFIFYKDRDLKKKNGDPNLKTCVFAMTY